MGQILRAEYANGEVGWEAATLAPPELLKTVHEATCALGLSVSHHTDVSRHSSVAPHVFDVL